MKPQWFYLDTSTIQGPFSEAEMEDRAARKMLSAADLVWRQGSDQNDAAPAQTIFDFFTPSAAVAPLPDWLEDVANEQPEVPFPRVLPSYEVPEWLEDLRLWISLDEPPAPEPPAAPPVAAPAVVPPLAAKAPVVQKSAVPPVAQQAPVAQQTPVAHQAPAAKAPVAIAPVVQAPVAIAPVVHAPVAIAPVVQAPVAIAPVVHAPVVYAPVAKAGGVQETVTSAARRLADITGFDADTGQILDAEKFQKWKQEKAHAAANQPGATNASLFEVFRKARTALEAWVDDDNNRLRILYAEIKELHKNPEIAPILQEYIPYGNEMQAKLRRHLEFIVENRRRYYRDMQGRPT